MKAETQGAATPGISPSPLITQRILSLVGRAFGGIILQLGGTKPVPQLLGALLSPSADRTNALDMLSTALSRTGEKYSTKS